MHYSDKDYHIFNGFILKIIGMIAMIIDHIAVFFEYFQTSIPSYNVDTVMVLRIIGRFAFIIFTFLVVEGILHSKNPIKYLIQLLVLSLVMDLIYFLITKEYEGNPITTLFIGGLMVYLLEQKKWYLKILSLIPLGLAFLMAFDLIPLKADYDIYGTLTILIFYIGNLGAKLFIKFYCKDNGLVEEAFINSSFGRTLMNLIPIALLIGFNIIIYILNPIWNGHGFFTPFPSIQIYSIFGLIPLIFYNGERGYNKPWFKYGCYLFFPIHILLIYLIFIIIL